MATKLRYFNAPEKFAPKNSLRWLLLCFSKHSKSRFSLLFRLKINYFAKKIMTCF